jgi:hypothetical protein
MTLPDKRPERIIPDLFPVLTIFPCVCINRIIARFLSTFCLRVSGRRSMIAGETPLQ